MGRPDAPSEVTWYHTMDLPEGTTAGEYDLRGVVDKVPWPAMAGRRCLDVGTHDGFWAFEMERRGAAAVTAIDIESPDLIDWPEPRPVLPEAVYEFIAARKTAFHHARTALGSSVEHRYVSVYDLDPAEVGTFDVAFIGTLLHHMRDPVGALMAIHRVCTGHLIVSGVISLSKSALHPGVPVTELMDLPGQPIWAIPNIAGLRRQIESAGFEVVERGSLHFQPTGSARVHDPFERSLRGLRRLPGDLMLRRGVPHVGFLARPV